MRRSQLPSSDGLSSLQSECLGTAAVVGSAKATHYIIKLVSFVDNDHRSLYLAPARRGCH